MDIVAALAELNAMGWRNRPFLTTDEYDRMAELCTAIDGWIARGGFTPEGRDDDIKMARWFAGYVNR